MSDRRQTWPASRSAGPATPHGRRLALPGDEVHVWRVRLRVAAPDLRRLERLLSGEERARAARVVSTMAAARYVTARAALREILARYLGIPAPDVALAYGPAGKPALARPHDTSRLAFSLAHSGDRALCAVARARVVGVDLERLRPDCAFEEVARAFFRPAERRALAAVPARARAKAFFRAWTAKEAYVKAVGGAVPALLGRVAVRVAPDGPPRLVGRRQRARWTVLDLRPGAGYQAMLVGEGAGWRVRRKVWRARRRSAVSAAVTSRLSRAGTHEDSPDRRCCHCPDQGGAT